MTFAIVGDTAADVQDHIADQQDVYLVETSVIIEGTEYLDNELPTDDLLAKFAEGKYSQTSQPSPAQFLERYEVASESLPVLGIHISSRLSGTFNGAQVVLQEFPDRDIVLFDSYNVSFGTGYFVAMAVHLRDRGFDRDQVYEVFQKVRDLVNLEIYIDDIEYLKRGGRVNLGQYWLLRILRLRPVVINEDGKIVQDALTRSGSSAVRKIIKRIKGYDDYKLPPLFVIGHITTPHIMEEMKRLLEDTDKSELWQVMISSTLLSHVGPDAFGVMVAPSIEELEQYIGQ